MEFVQLHVVSKNLQSIKSSDRFHDFVAEVDRYQFDLLLVAETWRGEPEENFLTADGHRLFLSGGSVGRHGVGIVVKRSLYAQMSNVVFHAYSDRLCSLHFTLDRVPFQIFSCYMPTSWGPYHAPLSNCMTCWSCYFQIANVLVPQRLWGVTSMQCWVNHAKGMAQISLELVGSDSEMNEDGCWLIGWPGLD